MSAGRDRSVGPAATKLLPMSTHEPGAGVRADGREARPASRVPRDAAEPWLERAQRGEGQAVERLLETVAAPVVGIVRVVMGGRAGDVDDVAQEALLAIYDAIPRFRAESSFTQYARRIAVRAALGARRRRPPVVEELSEELEDGE